MKLLGYKINSEIIGVDVFSWNEDDLNGNKPLLLSNTIQDGYEDITSIETFATLGDVVFKDYQEQVSATKQLINIKGWQALTSIEKDITIECNGITDNTLKIQHLMSKGYSQQEAITFLTDIWYIHFLELVDCGQERWNEAMKVVVTYITFDDASILLDKTATLINLYLKANRLGINYGDGKSGIMDYLESTNDFINNGLREEGFQTKIGTIDDMINALTNKFIDKDYI